MCIRDRDTIIGGGRYDRLVEELGGKPTPGVGFALGLERLLLASDKGEKPVSYTHLDVYKRQGKRRESLSSLNCVIL